MRWGLGVAAASATAALVAVSCPADTPSQARACSPFALEASETPIRVDLMGGHWQFEGNVLLVGCRSELDALTPDDRNRIVEGVRRLVTERHLAVLRRAELPVRAEAVRVLNLAVGRRLISDVWFQFSFSETDI